jgi:hypothetical protein
MSVIAAANHQNTWTPADAVTLFGNTRVNRKVTPILASYPTVAPGTGFWYNQPDEPASR